MKIKQTCLAAALVVALTATLFARDDKMENKGVQPAARGKIHTNNDRNGNAKLKVEVEHFATPQNLSPSHQFYEVWIQESGQPAQPIGELRINGKTEKGSVSGATPAKVFDVFVTAEDQRNATTPSSSEILRGHVDRS